MGSIMNDLRIKGAKGFLLDLDGVFIQSGAILPGALETVEIFNSRNIPYRFVTNTTTKSRDTLHLELTRQDIICNKEHIFSAGYSGAKAIMQMGNPSCKFFISEDLKKDYKFCDVNNENPDLIVIGDYDKWDVASINQAFNYVMGGSQILALHVGRYYKVKSGLKIDAGAFVKALEYATGERATVVVKPNVLFFKQALDDMKLNTEDVILVGDDLYNDIRGVQKLKIKGILVRSGKYDSKILQNTNVKPDRVFDSIKNLAEIIKS